MKAHRVMLFLMLATIASSAGAQVSRAGTPEQIRSARSEALPAIQAQFPGGYVTGAAGANSCELVVTTKKTAGDLVSLDVQRVDVGQLSSRIDESPDVLAGTVDIRVQLTTSSARVQRTRERIIEGVPQKPIVERAVFLAIPTENAGADARRILEALLKWSVPCERR